VLEILTIFEKERKMKNLNQKVVILTVFILTVLILAGVSFAGTYSGGSGNESQPYQIGNPDDWQELMTTPADWSSSFILTADVNLAGVTLMPVGGTLTPIWSPFTGIFDGNDHIISNAVINQPDSDLDRPGRNYVGLFGYVGSGGQIRNLGVEDVNMTGRDFVGGLVGVNYEGTITACYATGSVTGHDVGGLVGVNRGTITACYATGSVRGLATTCYCGTNVGGLVGVNYEGTLTACYATGSVTGTGTYVGGLVGRNIGTITSCYATGSVSGISYVGGLVGGNIGTLTACYATGAVSGTGDSVGGLVGRNYGDTLTACFWDIQTSGTSDGVGNVNPDPAGAIGKTTAEMKTLSTFTSAGWDFDTPTWTICEGFDYPKLWWEPVEPVEAPVLHGEPEVTLGTNNIISWDPVLDAKEYYVECSEDVNFTSIFDSSGWITETNFEFIGLELGQTYWYSVKARIAPCVESDWSNVVWSMQGTLGDAVSVMLDPNTLKNANMKNALTKKIDEVLAMIDAGLYEGALEELEKDILSKTDGCANSGQPDKDDWIKTCEEQGQIYPLIAETIEYVRKLME
jgi:hypothetical protein